jgi:putative transposase
VADITSRRAWAPFSTSRSFPTPGRRRIDGWAFSADLKIRVALDALDTVLVARKPDNVVPHSDRGSQYTSVAFGARCKEAAVGPSTGSVGDAYDNAMCESFFAALECELIDRRRFDLTARRGSPSFGLSKDSTIPHAATRLKQVCVGEPTRTA